MIYILNNFYASNFEDTCAILYSEVSSKDVVQICASLQFLLEELTDETAVLEIPCLTSILTEFYDFYDIKWSADCSSLVNLPMNTSGPVSPVQININRNPTDALLIDLYEARELCCGPDYKELMSKVLPTDETFENIVQLMLENKETV